MDVAVLQETPGEVEDNAVVHHGFTSYMRDHETGVDLDEFVWGVKWANLTCSQVQSESEAAGNWSRTVGVDFHEERDGATSGRAGLG
ncbi:hypothetical protein ADK90_14150 [Streptomyces sp. XY413]|uniref:YxiG-like protein n=1 Tax=Streptomyces sp. XY413 TaxID=1519479 RepID=UPI0006ADB069|nr:hypothetical protein [Streptomyces sp. XY413]KOV20079.1 hypothetical protein ADK90_14150 [Streptomyces sp. XY413]